MSLIPKLCIHTQSVHEYKHFTTKCTMSQDIYLLTLYRGLFTESGVHLEHTQRNNHCGLSSHLNLINFC